MSNYSKLSAVNAPRTELHDQLGLTSCEVSINTLPAGAAIPFVHSHKANEEIYGVLSGKGELYIDGEVIELKAGDWFRIAPAGERAIKASTDSEIMFVCIQAKAGSLAGYTMTDGLISEKKAPWHA